MALGLEGLRSKASVELQRALKDPPQQVVLMHSPQDVIKEMWKARGRLPKVHCSVLTSSFGAGYLRLHGERRSLGNWFLLSSYNSHLPLQQRYVTALLANDKFINH